MPTQLITTLFFAIFTIWAIQTTSLTTWASTPPSIYKALETHGLPMGLLPKGVENYTLDEDGRFEVHLDQACDAKFESDFYYDKNVFGQLSFGQIRNLSGISAQELFLWLPVKGIRVDIPSSGVIYFDVGVVRKQFSLSLFETPPDCVAALHPPNLQLGRPFAAGILTKKLDGDLRYRSNQGKNGRDIM